MNCENKRRLSLHGACNFRDLGGYRTTDGKTVKWGKLFRSDELSKLTGEDVSCLSRLGIKTIIDFRTEYESTKYPDIAIPETTRISMPPLGYSGFENLGKLLAGPPGKIMMDYYNQLITDPTARKAYSNMLNVVAQPKCLPVVIHCTEGKDRTGIGAALILLALGVPERTVIEDYMMSHGFRETENRKVIEIMQSKALLDTNYKYKAFESVLAARAEYLEEALRVIGEQYMVQ